MARSVKTTFVFIFFLGAAPGPRNASVRGRAEYRPVFSRKSSQIKDLRAVKEC